MEENIEAPVESQIEFKKPQSVYIKWLRHITLGFMVIIMVLAPTVFYAMGELNSTQSTFSVLYPGKQYNILKGNYTELNGKLKTYPVKDEALYIATVEVLEEPTAWEVLLAKLNPDAEIISPDENTRVVYEVPTAIIDYNEDEIGVSLNYALASALSYLKIPYESSLDIADVTILMEDGTVKKYDYVTLVNLGDEKITNFKQVEDYMFKIKDSSPVSLTVKIPDGDVQELTVKPAYSKTLKRYALGFYAIPRFKFDSKYNFNISSVQGGSAGLMLAIGAVERLTPEVIIPNSEKIGGTGAISSNGEVQEIAGLRQKLIGAYKQGNTLFFIPKVMCKDVVESYGSMKIVPVETLRDALEQLKRVYSNSKLNSCSVN